MDSDRLDVLACAIAVAMPRRTSLGAALGAGLAAVLPWLSMEGAEANQKRKKKKCKGGKKKCGKKCIPKANCCTSSECPTGAACESGACICPVGETDCGEACVDLATDGENCGDCGIVCDTGECVHGACTCAGDFDCFDGCTCAARNEGAPNGCTGGAAGAACAVDGDCPLGAVCRLGNTCSTPCLL